MDWSRPENVREIAATYSSFDIVGEIIILVMKPTAPYNYTFNRVKVFVDYSANTRYGLSSRFIGCNMASRKYVVIQDDDIIHTEIGLRTLAEATIQDPNRIIGHFCRTWNISKGTSYVPYQPRAGLHPIVLTNTLITPREFCSKFFEYEPLVHAAVQGSIPYWNGEDIFLNLVSFKVSGNMPRCIPSPKGSLKTMPHADRGMSVKNKSHLPYRRWFLAVAANALGVYRGEHG